MEVRIKNHVPHDYRPYVKVEIKTLDPNGEVPEWELTSNRVNPFERENKGNKRAPEDFPENQRQKKKNRGIPDWRIGEFLWMYLQGTKTKPDYETEDVNLEEIEEVEEHVSEETVEDHPETVENDNNLDN